MKLGVQVALKAVQHVDHIGKPRLLQRRARLQRALPAATNQQHRAVLAPRFFLHQLAKLSHMGCEVRVLVPRNVHRARRAPDIHRLDLHPDIDHQAIGVGLHKGPGFTG